MMKIALFALACFIGSVVSAEIEETIDWHQIKPLDLAVEPIGPPAKLPGLRIIGGSEAGAGQFPYQLALIINNSGFCGASLISTTAALTAAHCVDSSSNVQITAGAHNRNLNEIENSQVTLRSSNRIVHSGWNPGTLQNDIAILRFNPVPLNNRIRVIGLAPANIQNIAGHTAVLSGWGRTSDSSQSISAALRFVHLPIITHNVCQQSFGNRINAQHICTSGQGIRGACNGDSGGPLVWNNVEVGVVSFGSSRCQAGHPTVFARVSFFRNWIRQNAGV